MKARTFPATYRVILWRIIASGLVAFIIGAAAGLAVAAALFGRYSCLGIG